MGPMFGSKASVNECKITNNRPKHSMWQPVMPMAFKLSAMNGSTNNATVVKNRQRSIFQLLQRSPICIHSTVCRKTVCVASENENKQITGNGGAVCKYRCSNIRKPTPKATKIKAWMYFMCIQETPSVPDLRRTWRSAWNSAVEYSVNIRQQVRRTPAMNET